MGIATLCSPSRRVRGGTTAVIIAAFLASCSGGGDSPAPPTSPGGGGGAGSTTGSIAGRVIAASTGTGLPGATVATTPATSSATTDAQGNYTIPTVAAGSYTVTATLAGFVTGTAVVSVSGGQVAAGNLTLAAAGLTFSQVGTLQASAQGVSAVALSPNGATLAYGEFGSNLIRIVNVATRTEVRTLAGHTKPVTVLAFSADSRFLASQGTVNLPPGIDGTVRVWDLTSGAQLASMSMGTTGAGHLAFSPDGTLLASASGGDPLRVQLSTPSTLAPVRTFSGVFRRVAFSPDGRRVATLARDERVRIIDVATGAEVSALAGHTGWVTATAFDAGGTTVASGSEDRSIRLWNASTGQTIRTLTGHTTYPDQVMFSPDGAALASLGSGTNITRSGSSVTITISSADRTLRLWNATTGAALLSVNSGSDVVTGATFSASWGTLVTASSAGLIRFFAR